jgi:hypothetical protein
MQRLSIVILGLFLASFSFAAENKSNPRAFPEVGYCADDFAEVFYALSLEYNNLVQLNHGKEELPPLFNLDRIGWESGALFITRPIANRGSSVPEASTMILWGLGLICLAGYGGRKKFKR